jgi:hypothetical protein
MKRIFLALTIFLLLTSCATLTNQAWTVSTIYTTEPTKIVFQNDTIKTKRNKVKLILERQNAPIEIIAITDSLKKKVTIKAINSIEYWANIAYFYGIGMLIDNRNPKRYTYPPKIYLNSTDTINKYYNYYERWNNKGQLLLHLSLPHINSFLLTPENEGTKSNTGFWGISLGLDYFHSKNQYVNLSLSGVSDFFAPVPAAVDIWGEYELMSSAYLSLSNNHKIKRFSLGYGLSYVENTWDLRDYGGDETVPTREPVKKTNYALGLIFSSYFQATPNFYLGVIYRPTLLRPDIKPTFKYEHLISIDFAWKIRLFNIKRWLKS